MDGWMRRQVDKLFSIRQDLTVRLRSRVFPMMLSLNAPSKFNYDGCSFKVQKSKVSHSILLNTDIIFEVL